jgi:hypothetical protein
MQLCFPLIVLIVLIVFYIQCQNPDPKKIGFELETGCFKARFFFGGTLGGPMSNVVHKNTTIIQLGPSRKQYSTAKQLNLNDASQE